MLLNGLLCFVSTKAFFHLALLYHLQAYGSKEEDVEKYMRNGIIIWGSEITKVQDDGKLLVNQVKIFKLIKN